MDTGLVERLPAAEPDPEADAEAATVAALARGLELGAGEGDPWDYLTAWRIDGPAPLRWRLEPEGGGEVVEVVGAERTAAAEHAGEGRLAVTHDGERRTLGPRPRRRGHARGAGRTRMGLSRGAHRAAGRHGFGRRPRWRRRCPATCWR